MVGDRRAPPAIPRRAPTAVEQFGKPVAGSDPTIVRAFKSAVTRQINQVRQTPGAPVWQRNYYEHIIRDEQSYEKIAAYILNNPRQWEADPSFQDTILQLLIAYTLRGQVANR